MQWQFEPVGVTKNNPTHLGYFENEALENSTNALIREDIQNRLDAKSGKEKNPVLLRYYLPSKPLEPKKAARWLEGLEQHVNSPLAQEKLGAKLDLAAPMSFITLECFHTTGLVGDPEQRLDPVKDDSAQNFFWFIRNIGRSNKKNGDRGKWGLGKIVYPASSNIRSFFSYSVEENNHNESLIGRSVLCIHATPNRKEYESEGYFAEYNSDGSDRPLGWPSPTSDSDTIINFKNDFGITREPDNSGLSIVIPHPKKSITYESIFTAVIKQYFWEILRGSLECNVADDTREILLESKNLIDEVLASPHFKNQEKSLIEARLLFCRKADNLKLNSDDYYELNIPKSYGNPKMQHLFKSEDCLNSAIKKFQAGELLAFECPVIIAHTKNNIVNEASFLVYLQKEDTLCEPDEIFIRDGLTIIGEKHLNMKSVRSLVLAEDGILSEFLGDSENPAHTHWMPATEHFKGKYKKGGSILNYVKQIASRLANGLGKIEDEDLADLLEDVFGIPIEDPDKNKKPSKKRGKKKPKPPTKIKPRPKYIQTSKLQKGSGFRITPSPDANATPTEIKIKVAYDVEQGSALSSYHPADFDFVQDDLAYSTEGCEILLRELNQITISILAPDFNFSISGFDGKRDLYVQPIPVK